MKIHIQVPNWLLSIIFFLAGGTWSIIDKLVKTTSWAELFNPWYVFIFMGGAFIQLISFWVSGKAPKPPTASTHTSQETNKDQ